MKHLVDFIKESFSTQKYNAKDFLVCQAYGNACIESFYMGWAPLNDSADGESPDDESDLDEDPIWSMPIEDYGKRAEDFPWGETTIFEVPQSINNDDDLAKFIEKNGLKGLKIFQYKDYSDYLNKFFFILKVEDKDALEDINDFFDGELNYTDVKILYQDTNVAWVLIDKCIYYSEYSYCSDFWDNTSAYEVPVKYKNEKQLIDDFKKNSAAVIKSLKQTYG